MTATIDAAVSDPIAELQEDLDEWIRSYNPASQHPSVYVIEEKRFC